MSTTFICHHCKQRHHPNIRLREKQRYCGSTGCQQARKNEWERNKLRSDPVYRLKRRADKKRWYSNYPGDKYQSGYRKSHRLYCSENRKGQVLRNESRKITTGSPKIVKTDTLTSESVVSSGFYALFPCADASGEKIVKTDALIVQLSGIQHDVAFLFNSFP